MKLHRRRRGHIAAIAAIPAVVSGLLFLASCATQSGSLGSEVVRVERGESEESTDGEAVGSEADDREDEPEDALRLSATPVDAVVFLNDRYMGEAPLTVSTLDPGRYTLRVEAEGYVSVTQTIRVGEESNIDIAIELQPITGKLALSGELDGAVVRIDGSSASSVAVDSTGGTYELPIGSYEVEVSRFGYEPFRRRVTIHEMETTSLDVELTALRFEITEISVSRERFSPANAGALGTAAIRFSVTTPGRGTLRVEDADGEVVYRKSLDRFSDPDQRVVWDGSVSAAGDGAGSGSETAPDGTYFAVVRASGAGFDGSDEESVPVTVDSSVVLRYRGLISGVAGLAYAGLPDALPAGAWQVDATVLGHRTTVDGAGIGRIPAFAALRIGVAPKTELAVEGGAVSLTSGEQPRWFASASVKRQLLQTGTAGPAPVAAAVALRGTVQGAGGRDDVNSPDTLTNFPGIALSAPITVGGSAKLVITPELLASPARPIYSEADAAGAGSGWDAWAYARIGAMYERPGWSVGASAALRSMPFGEGFGIDLPMQAALEGRVIIPGSSVFVSGVLAGELAAVNDFYLVGGGSLGVVF